MSASGGHGTVVTLVVADVADIQRGYTTFG